jgi:hypothetical protein
MGITINSFIVLEDHDGKQAKIKTTTAPLGGYAAVPTGLVGEVTHSTVSIARL